MTALLLAEPEANVRGFLERQLRSDGFDVVACERAEQLPRAADPDLLVLGDAEALDRGVVPDCPVIVLGGSDPASRVRALARADDCLPRPFVYEELLALISYNGKTRFRLHAGLLCQFKTSAAPRKCPNDTGKTRKTVNAVVPGLRVAAKRQIRDSMPPRTSKRQALACLLPTQLGSAARSAAKPPAVVRLLLAAFAASSSASA